MRLRAREVSGVREGGVPGAFRTILDSAISRDRDAYPDIYNVRIEYADDTGRRAFTDDHVIDLGLYWDTSEIRRTSVHHVAEQLERLVKKIGNWGASMPGGLLVVTPDEEREALETFKREREEVMRARAQEPPPEA